MVDRSVGEEDILTSSIPPQRNLYLYGLPVDCRVFLGSKSGTRNIVSLSSARPFSEYTSRFTDPGDSAVVCWEQTTPAVVQTCAAEGLSLYLARPGAARPAGNAIEIEPVDVLAELRKLPPVPVSAPSGAETDPLAGLMFAARATGRSRKAPIVPWPEGKDVPVTVDDITVVFGVRLHADNPWLLDRIAWFAEYYDPCPKVIVVDFGSEVAYSEQLEKLCHDTKFRYVYVHDKDVFSLSTARNIGSQNVSTDLIFFSDPDFFFVRDFFARLVQIANTARMRHYIDVVLMCAAYHLTENTTRQLMDLGDVAAFSSSLDRIGFHATFEKFGETVEFVAPYSNVFLINRRLMSISGGYEATFRGHGSEDFEFMVRVTRYTNFLPLPESIDTDDGGPLNQEFFNGKKFSGFRILSNLVAMPSLMSGLKAFHLYHPRGNGDPWTINNDWRRTKLKKSLAVYTSRFERLLEIDSLERKAKVLCICVQPDHWGYFAPLRLRGYQLVPIYEGSVEEIERATNMILAGEVSALAVFNPYMTSHAKFRALHLLAKEKSKTIIIERGALPNTCYYASDVAYADPAYSEEAFQAFRPSDEDLKDAHEYIAWLRLGESTLEHNQDYEVTRRKFHALEATGRTVCFVPLQLEYDMAVTMFQRPVQQYAEFAASIDGVARNNPDIVFMVKPHPLSKGEVDLRAPNVITADSSDNIHALIDIASCTICYNSGVGLLSIIHGRPTYTIGNAYYNRGSTGIFCESFSDAVARHMQAPHQPDPSEVARLVAWLRRHRYSYFTAVDNVKEFAERKVHGYKNVVVTRLVLDGQADDLGRSAVPHPFAEESYGMGLIGLSLPLAPGTRSVPDDLRPKLRLAENSRRLSGGDIEIGAGTAGHGVYGPYLSLNPGRYMVALELSVKRPGGFLSQVTPPRIDIVSDSGKTVLGAYRLSRREMWKGIASTELSFEVPSGKRMAIEIRIWTDGKTRLLVKQVALASQ